MSQIHLIMVNFSTNLIILVTRIKTNTNETILNHIQVGFIGKTSMILAIKVANFSLDLLQVGRIQSKRLLLSKFCKFYENIG